MDVRNEPRVLTRPFFYDMLAVNIIKMEQAFHCFQSISIEAN